MLDLELERLLTVEDDIYHQLPAVNGLLDRSLRLAQAVEIRRVPVAQASLQTLF